MQILIGADLITATSVWNDIVWRRVITFSKGINTSCEKTILICEKQIKTPIKARKAAHCKIGQQQLLPGETENSRQKKDA